MSILFGFRALFPPPKSARIYALLLVELLSDKPCHREPVEQNMLFAFSLGVTGCFPPQQSHQKFCVIHRYVVGESLLSA